MIDADTEKQYQWPLEGIRLVTALKVDSFDIFHHEGDNPYYQISIGASVLDGFGDVSPANIELCADDGDSEEVHRLETLYCEGSLHWVDATAFRVMDGTFQFYAPLTTPMPCKNYDLINEFFIATNKWVQKTDNFEMSKQNISEISNPL